jgi:hypothetical protein
MEQPAQSFQLMSRQITHGSAAVELDGLEEAARLRLEAHAGGTRGAYPARRVAGARFRGAPLCLRLGRWHLPLGPDGKPSSSAADTINGREGNDALYGKGGNDFLYGGTGNDKISSGKGTDQLIGGDGADIFVFAGGSGTDTITDFKSSADKIRLNLTSLG